MFDIITIPYQLEWCRDSHCDSWHHMYYKVLYSSFIQTPQSNVQALDIVKTM